MKIPSTLLLAAALLAGSSAATTAQNVQPAFTLRSRVTLHRETMARKLY